MRSVVVAAVLASTIAIPMTPPAGAVEGPDQVFAWNKIAYDELIGALGQPPPVSVFHLAMVHGAVYDAVNAIDGGYQPYLDDAPEATGSESRNAAAAAAARGVLVSLLPDARDQIVNDLYDDAIEVLEGVEDPADVAAGETVGEAAAAAMIAARVDDGRFGFQFFTEGTDGGDWQNLVAPLSPAGNNFKWVGDVDPFVIEDASDFATSGPKDMGSEAYAAEWEQVRSLGAADSTTRTANQSSMALFWADHTIAMWTRIARQVSEQQALTSTENARYFAMLYLTVSDAVIACFEDKERWAFWRPQTAIRLANLDENDATTADPTWTSFIANPPYPDHPSGANCAGSAFVSTLQDFFGTDRMSFSATRATSPIGQITRNFSRFSQARREVKFARIYAGIHFMSADAQAVSLGRKVADYREAHAFGPA